MKCKALTTSGSRCRNNALPDSDYCMVPSHQLLAVGDQAMAEQPAVLVPAKPEPAAGDNACGHTNVHAKFYDEQGKPYYLHCDLQKGHDGPHGAWYQAVDYKNQGVTRNERARTSWGDMAGTPAEDIKADLYSLPPTHPQHPEYNDLLAKLSR